MKNEIKKFFIYFNLIFTYTFKRKNVVVVVVIFYIAACNLKFDCNDYTSCCLFCCYLY